MIFSFPSLSLCVSLPPPTSLFFNFYFVQERRARPVKTTLVQETLFKKKRVQASFSFVNNGHSFSSGEAKPLASWSSKTYKNLALLLLLFSSSFLLPSFLLLHSFTHTLPSNKKNTQPLLLHSSSSTSTSATTLSHPHTHSLSHSSTLTSTFHFPLHTQAKSPTVVPSFKSFKSACLSSFAQAKQALLYPAANSHKKEKLSSLAFIFLPPRYTPRQFPSTIEPKRTQENLSVSFPPVSPSFESINPHRSPCRRLRRLTPKSSHPSKPVSFTLSFTLYPPSRITHSSQIAT